MPSQVRLSKRSFKNHSGKVLLESTISVNFSFFLPSGSPDAADDKVSVKQGGYIDRLPVDPWGNPYQYLNPGAHGTIDIYSLGADGQLGGNDVSADIGNWNLE